LINLSIYNIEAIAFFLIGKGDHNKNRNPKYQTRRNLQQFSIKLAKAINCQIKSLGRVINQQFQIQNVAKDTKNSSFLLARVLP
jgi:hypothetical protein